MCLTEDIDSSGGVEVDGFFRITNKDVSGGRVFVIEDATSVNICLELGIYGFESIDYLLRYFGN